MHHVSDAAFRTAPRVDRVALLSVHTCPLDQPGTGDAGGMNVYLREVARRLGEMGVQVDIYTRDAGCPQQVAEFAPGARAIHLAAGPRSPVPKDEVAGLLEPFTYAMLAFAAADSAIPDIVHANYWMSGRVGRLVADRWRIPFIQTFHTLAKVKNIQLAPGDRPEPVSRIQAEERIVRAADQILAPTIAEASELVEFYGADPSRVRVVSPGVDTDLFAPRGSRTEVRASLGWPDRPTILFVGRLQPLKSPEVAVRAVAALADQTFVGARPRLVIVGGPSGYEATDPRELRALGASLGLDPGDLELHEPASHAWLAEAYRAADLTILPSRTESFGLVALESQACGTPVVASDVGGLRTAVRDGETGLLVAPGDIVGFAGALGSLLDDPQRLARFGSNAARFARRFDWRWVARGVLSAYEDAAAAGAHRRAAGLTDASSGADAPEAPARSREADA